MTVRGEVPFRFGRRRVKRRVPARAFTEGPEMSEEVAPKLSPVEAHKAEGRYLRGTLPEELADPALDHLSDANKSLLKFHGSYEQEDRDARKARSKAGVGKAYMFMIRLKLPGGKMTADQWLTMDDIAGRYANGTLRLTTRQSIQFHGVLKTNLKATMADINHALVTTLGGCGDVNRNVLSCPAPLPDPTRAQMMRDCEAVAAHLAPRAGARTYHEIWLNGEPQPATPAAEVPNPEADEPIYGKTYLPRKFKVAFSLPHDNCTDILAQCLGYLAITEGGKPVGYNLFAGGGQGQTNSEPGHLPAARPAGRVHRARRGDSGSGRDHQVVPRPRQPQQPEAGAAEVRDEGLGAGEVPRGVLPRLLPARAPRPAPGRNHRPRPAPRLAKYGWREVVPRAVGGERPGEGRRVAAAAERAAGDRVEVPVRRAGSPRSRT
jgi:hypothetical protein